MSDAPSGKWQAHATNLNARANYQSREKAMTDDKQASKLFLEWLDAYFVAPPDDVTKGNLWDAWHAGESWRTAPSTSKERRELLAAQAKLTALRSDIARHVEIATAAQSELAAMRERLSAAEELLREIRDGEVNAEDEADKFLRDDRESAIAESRRANAHLQSELRKMLSPEMDWENGEIGVGGKFREVARNALTTTADEQKAWEDALWGEPVGSISEHDLTWLKDHSRNGAKIDVYAYVNNLHPVELYAKPKGLK